MSDPPALLTLYFPLWGATFDSEQAGLAGGSAMVLIPFEDEWRSMQQTDVVYERMSMARGLAPIPPPCVVVGTPLLGDETIDDAVLRAGSALIQDAQNAVLVLRLFKDGWFLEPELAESCFAVAESGWQLRRRPGFYRQAFLGGDAQAPLAPYHVQISDLTVDVARPGNISQTWELFTRYRSLSGNASVEIAVENFSRSYGFQLTPIDRLANLFMALDAMLGGMSARRIGRIQLRRNYFRKRVQSALEATGGLPGTAPQEDAEWLDSRDGGRGLRNAIAHGDYQAISQAAGSAQERLQGIVRALLKQYLHFAVCWAQDQPAVSVRFRLPDKCSLAAAYCKVLEARAMGSDSGAELLTA